MDYVSFRGGETSGSIGKRSVSNVRQNPIQIQSPSCDTINFKGRDDDRPTFGKTLMKGVASIGITIGVLGFAHKKNLFGKLNNSTLKKYVNRATEPCYNICHKVKNFVIDLFNKIKDKFSK